MLLGAALFYAARGWPVIPLHGWTGQSCTCGRKDCGSPAKHPKTKNGLKDASTDEQTIRSWWGRWPAANVGLRTGVAFDALDIDGEEGFSSAQEAETTYGNCTSGPTSMTGGGGMHQLYQVTGVGNRAGILAHVDWRGANGYIVAPPSLHASGNRYEWSDICGPETEIDPVSGWLHDLLFPPKADRRIIIPSSDREGAIRYVRRAIDAEIGELIRTPEGQRNDALNRAGFNLYQLVASGAADENDVTNSLHRAAAGMGLGEREIILTLESAKKAGLAQPRHVPQLRTVGDDERVAPPQAVVHPIEDEQPDGTLAPISLYDHEIYEFINQVEPDYQWIIPDIAEAGDRIILTGPEGGGKALSVGTPILSGRGWLTMGDIKVGDTVYRPDGQSTMVVAATDVMHDRPCYQIRFSDGAIIIADAQHQWVTHGVKCREAESRTRHRAPEVRPRGTDQQRKRTAWPYNVTTAEMAASLRARDGHVLDHAIPVAGPFDANEAHLPIHPYALGVWLGDGHSAGARLTGADPEIADHLAAVGEPVRKETRDYGWTWSETTKAGPRSGRFVTRLRSLGVINNKHIPSDYQLGSVSQRLALLQGLMDTDGTVEATRPKCEFCVTSEQLARDTYDLICGLGIKVAMTSSPAVLDGRHVGTRYRLSFTTDLPVFRLSRKAERISPLRTERGRYRYVTAVEPVDSVPVRCIQVAHSDGMFCAGKEMIATHNSTLLRQVAIQVAAGIHPFTLNPMEPRRTLIVDLENGRRHLRRSLRPLVQIPGEDQLAVGMSRVISLPSGIDLTDGRHVEWLNRRFDIDQPELVVIGPIYKMANGNPNDEEVAKKVAYVLDDLRTRYDCCFLIEAHQPYAAQGSNRPERPYGASLWSRWPEFGLHLSISGDLRHWRGDRDERAWPKTLVHGTPWPWIVDNTEDTEEAYDGPSHCRDAIAYLLSEFPAEEFSVNSLMLRLRAKNKSYRKDTVSVAAEQLADAGSIIARSGPRGARLFMYGGTRNA